MTNNLTNTELLARWVAEKVGDFLAPALQGGGINILIEEPTPISVTIEQYLNCKNVAGRLMEYAISEGDTTTNMYRSERLSRAILKFRINAWDNTPAAIEDIAKACGWTAPIIDTDTGIAHA